VFEVPVMTDVQPAQQVQPAHDLTLLKVQLHQAWTVTGRSASTGGLTFAYIPGSNRLLT
jgi:hypothetical protein